MVVTPFTPMKENEFLELMKLSNELGIIHGSGIKKRINIFKVYKPTQRGGSIFSILTNLGRKTLPFLRKYIFPSAQNFASNVVSDLVSGQNIKKTFKKHGKQSLQEIGKRLVSGGRVRKHKKRVRKLKCVRKRRGMGKYKKKCGVKKHRKKKILKRSLTKGGVRRRKRIKKIKKSKTYYKPRINKKCKKQRNHDIFS